MKILIMGLPGSGKTYLAERLAKHLNAVLFNADRVRATINNSLGFSVEDRVEHARRMGWMCQLVKDSGHIAIADFICPTPEAREAFKPDFVIWMDTIKEGRYEDTNKIFIAPAHADLDVIITGLDYDVDGLLKDVARHLSVLSNSREVDTFDGHSPTALLLGRYQPFHDGHYQLCLEALARVGTICIAVRDTVGLEKNPFSFDEVKTRIIEKFVVEGMWDSTKIKIISVPNITSITYGRDVGYSIDKIDLSPELQAVSATKVRASMGL